MTTIDRYDIDQEPEQELSQHWLSDEFESEIPDAPESWELDDFEDVLGSTDYLH